MTLLSTKGHNINITCLQGYATHRNTCVFSVYRNCGAIEITLNLTNGSTSEWKLKFPFILTFNLDHTRRDVLVKAQ